MNSYNTDLKIVCSRCQSSLQINKVEEKIMSKLKLETTLSVSLCEKCEKGFVDIIENLQEGKND